MSDELINAIKEIEMMEAETKAEAKLFQDLYDIAARLSARLFKVAMKIDDDDSLALVKQFDEIHKRFYEVRNKK